MKLKLSSDGNFNKRLKRQFLENDADSYCVTSIDVYRIINGHQVWGELKLSDCNRQVHLSFSPKNMKKLDKLIDQLVEFKAAMIDVENQLQQLKQEETND